MGSMKESNSGKRSRVLVIGLDGATFDLITPWVRRGFLPNLSRFLAEGSCAELQSLYNATSPLAWSTIVTGTNPGKHGIFYFTEKTRNSYAIRYVNASFRKQKAIWKYLSDAGKRVVVVNVPMTYPPEAINGVMISGIDTPSTRSAFTYPPEIADEIRSQVGDYIIDLRLRGTRANEITILRDLHVMVDKRIDTVLHLMRNHAWDFFMAVLTATDRVQHRFWCHMDANHPRHPRDASAELRKAIFSIYRHIDTRLAELLEVAGRNTSVMIVSDHGFGPASDLVFYPNNWLRSIGMLSWKDARGNGNPVASLMKSIRRLGFRGVHQGKRVLASMASRGQKEFLLRVFPSLRDSLQGSFLSKIDWSNTRAFSDELSSVSGIYINVKGREPEGIVEPGAEYERVREEIVDELSELKSPDKDTDLVERVLKREEIYHGPFVEKAPDLLILWKDMSIRIRKSFRAALNNSHGAFGWVRGSWRASGFHRLNGVLMLRGEGIRKGTCFDGAGIADITPTLLYMLGLPVNSDMDGNVLQPAFERDYLRAHPITYREVDESPSAQDTGTEYEEEESNQVEQRLRGLGYID